MNGLIEGKVNCSTERGIEVCVVMLIFTATACAPTGPGRVEQFFGLNLVGPKH